MIPFVILLRLPFLDPLRVAFPLMMPRMYHRPYCKEVLGLPAGPDSAKSRDDPEGHFRRCPHHVTDTRLDPKIFDEDGNPIAFRQIRKGDIVNLRVAIETRWVNRKKIGIHLILKRVTIKERGVQSNPCQIKSLPFTFTDRDVTIKDDSDL